MHRQTRGGKGISSLRTVVRNSPLSPRTRDILLQPPLEVSNTLAYQPIVKTRISKREARTLKLPLYPLRGHPTSHLVSVWIRGVYISRVGSSHAPPQRKGYFYNNIVTRYKDRGGMFVHLIEGNLKHVIVFQKCMFARRKEGGSRPGITLLYIGSPSLRYFQLNSAQYPLNLFFKLLNNRNHCKFYAVIYVKWLLQFEIIFKIFHLRCLNIFTFPRDNNSISLMLIHYLLPCRYFFFGARSTRIPYTARTRGQ